jgi:hypothetical protein
VSDVGCAVTPVGSPVIATVTIPAKPLAGVAFTLICCPAPPGTSVMLAGVEIRLKSPSVAGTAGLEAPLQESNRRQRRKPEHPTSIFEKAPIANSPNSPKIGLQNVRQPDLPRQYQDRQYIANLPQVVISCLESVKCARMFRTSGFRV